MCILKALAAIGEGRKRLDRLYCIETNIYRGEKGVPFPLLMVTRITTYCST